MSAPRRHGFTLVELMSTVAVLSVLSTVASVVLFNSMDAFLDATTRAQLNVEASIGLDRIVRELRRVDLDTGAAGVAPDIEAISSNGITWNDDYALALSGTDLLYQDNGGTPAILLADVTGFALEARDESGALLSLPLAGASCDPVRRVTITLTLERYGVAEVVRTAIFLRATMVGAGP